MLEALIVDDHPVVLLAVKMLLQRCDIVVSAETGCGYDALKKARLIKPELIILDIGLPGMDGLELLSRLKNFNSQSRILVLSSKPAETWALRCAKAGASGFVAKDEGLGDLEDAIKAVRKGKLWFPAALSPSLLGASCAADKQAGPQNLSSRELAVLQYLASGWANKRIADELNLSCKTISTYKTRLLKKLSAGSLIELVDIAKQQALVS